MQVATQRETISSLLAQDKYKKRFEQVLGERAPQFISSILSLGATMADVEPRSVLASAAIAASLNLPVNPTLGFAWIVPYKKNGVKYGQFQCGYRGLIQLAQRTGAYSSMNAEAVNAEVYKGRNKVGEPIIDWEALDESKPVAGYVFAFEMINGFSKVCYWSKEKVERHAQKYSQAYRSGHDGPWRENFDRMGLKTVVSNELRRWGMLSVELQGAFAEDHSIHKDIDAPAEFPEAEDGILPARFDGEPKDPQEEKAEAAAGLAPQQQPAAPAPAAAQPKRTRQRRQEAQTMTEPAQPVVSSQSGAGLGTAPAPISQPPVPPTQPSPAAAKAPGPSATTVPVASTPQAAAGEPAAATGGELFATESYRDLRAHMEQS